MDPVLIVLVREVFDGTTLDEDVVASLRLVPDWLLREQKGRI